MKSILTLLLFISIGCCGQKDTSRICNSGKELNPEQGRGLNWQDILNRNGSDTSYTIDWGESKPTYDTTYGIILYIQMEDSLILGVYDNAPVFAPSFSPILARAMRVERVYDSIGYIYNDAWKPLETTRKTILLIDLQTPKILDPDKWFIFIPYSKFQK